MRLIRVGALFGSLMLLVATLVSLVNQRSELFNEQDTRVQSAATAAANSVQNTLLRARAVLEVANTETTPDELLATFGPTAEACIGTVCSGPDLAALGTFGAAAATPTPSAAVVDRASNSVLVVAQTSDVVASIQLPLEVVVGTLTRQSIAELGTVVDVRTSTSEQPRDVAGIVSEGGERVVLAQISEALDDGSVLVRTSVSNDVGWGADTPGLYATLLALGTILLALAGWTFLVERRQLERRATTDELTGLANRREFELQSEEAIEMASRFGTGLCIMLIDLNGFKQINDNLGHQFGDIVLKACADRLLDAVRDTDLVARWGGDEFVVMLPGLSEASGVRNSAERLGSSMSSSPVADDVSISGSIGAALYPRHGTTFQELMQAADVAMYEAKTTGVIHRLASTADADRELPPPNYEGPDRRKTAVTESGPPAAKL